MEAEGYGVQCTLAGRYVTSRRQGQVCWYGTWAGTQAPGRYLWLALVSCGHAIYRDEPGLAARSGRLG